MSEPLFKLDEHGRRAFARTLLAWFAKNARPLPWREDYEPYAVWISEIMLQQTQMDRGVAYFERWMRAFPTPAALLAGGSHTLAAAGCGYRGAYLLDAARRVAEGDIDLDAIGSMAPEEGEATLCRILGVGSKVAKCALLFGFGQFGCVPQDVWIKRALAAFYPQGLPEAILPVGGIAQQYIFHYVRHHPQILEQGLASLAD